MKFTSIHENKFQGGIFNMYPSHDKEVSGKTEADEDVLGEAQKSLSRQIPGRMDMSSVQGPPVGWVI